MPHLMLRQIPRFECLIEASKLYPDINPKAFEAFLHLLHAGDEVVRHFSSFLTSMGLSQGRFAVLMLLMHKVPNIPSPSTPAELADMCACTRATMTGLIDTLEKDGLVRREPDSEDRRVMRVRLTEQGAKLADGVIPVHFRNITALMNALTESEQHTLVELLCKILNRIGDKPDAAPAQCAAQTGHE